MPRSGSAHYQSAHRAGGKSCGNIARSGCRRHCRRAGCRARGSIVAGGEKKKEGLAADDEGGDGGNNVRGSRRPGMSLRGEEMACLIPNVRVAVGKERALFLFYYYYFFLKKRS